MVLLFPFLLVSLLHRPQRPLDIVCARLLRAAACRKGLAGAVAVAGAGAGAVAVAVAVA